MKLKKKLLIAGGTGFIGYHLAMDALKRGYSVTSLSTKNPKKYRYLKRVKYLKCNTLKKKLLKKKIKIDYDVVVNLSGYVNHYEKKKTFSSHYTGCKNLADIFINKNLKSFIQMGSGMENGNVKSPQKEKLNCKPLSNYALAKYNASSYLLNLFKNKKFPVTVLRLYQAYGPKQNLNRLISIVIDKSLKNQNIPCTLGRQKRDFLYIDDLINVIFKVINSKQSHGKIFNIGSSEPIRIRDVIKKIIKIIKKGKPQFGKIALRKEELQNMYPSINKAKKILSWKPKVSLEQGLKLTIKNFKNESKYK